MGKWSQVLGVYSKNIKDHTGTGATLQSRETKTYYFVLKSDSDEYHVQPLNLHNIPSGMFSSMDRIDFISSFTPEINYYLHHPLPEMEILKEMLAAGEEYASFESAHKKVLTLIKALLKDPGNSSVDLADPLAAPRLAAIVDTLSNQTEELIEEQRQEFNSAAISLRKEQLYEEAISFYTKALELSDGDENLHFNIARAYFEIGNNNSALEHLDHALSLSPQLESALLFKKYILKNQ